MHLPAQKLLLYMRRSTSTALSVTKVFRAFFDVIYKKNPDTF
jgi:hypothetical protein